MSSHNGNADTVSSNGAYPSVRFAGVSKSFGDFTAVHDLNLDIERGEFFTLLGPSGCGKTTSLRMVAGFEEPTEGQILLDGINVAGLPPFKRSTNTVFQSYALFPHLSVEENVAFGLRRKGVDKGETKSRVAAELQRVGLDEQAKRKPNQLSGGQQQRVALARALVNLPTVLLLDEPLGALDLKLRKGLQLELKKIQRDVGITFVYVTHDQEEALTMSDRIAVMNKGVIEQVDSPVSVYERPATTFVAGFIGVSNLMPGEIRSVNADLVELDLVSGVSVTAKGVGFEPGQSAYAVVRPEKLKILSEGERSSWNDPVIDGTAVSSVFLGTATQVIVDIGQGVTVTAMVPNVDEQSRAQLPQPGSSVALSWSNNNLHLVRETDLVQV